MSDPPKPLGCDKNIDGDQLAALKNISPNEMKALIDSHAGSEGCKNEIKNSLDTAVSRGQTMDIWLRDSATVSGSVGWGGASGSAGVSLDTGMSTTDSNLSTESTTMSGISSGCRQTLMNINESNSLYSQMTCNIKSASNTTATDIRMGATISVRVGPTDAQVAAYDRKVAGINDNIARLMNRPVMNEFSIKALDILNEALIKADAGFRFNVTNSSFKITNNNIQKLISSNNQEIENNTQIREAILKKATSEAISDITQKFEMGAQASQDLEAYASSKINDTSLSTTQDIVQAANDTKLSVDMNGNITLNINGSLDGTNVDITQGNLTEMRTELIMKAASELGKDVAAEIIHEALTKGSADTEGTGLASYQKAIADGLAAQAKNLKPGGGGLFGGLFGGMIGKIAMIAIPIIIIIVLFSMFGFKIALVAGLIFGIYLAIAYFVGLTPFSKEKNESPSVLQAPMRNLSRYNSNFMDQVRNVVVPRRRILLNELQNWLNDTIDKANNNQNTSFSYMNRLNSTSAYIEDAKNNAVLLSEWRPERISEIAPIWFLIASVILEKSIWDTLYNQTNALAIAAYGDRSQSDLDEVLQALKAERDFIGNAHKQLMIEIERIPPDSPFFAEVGEAEGIAKAAVAFVTRRSEEQPESWKRLLNIKFPTRTVRDISASNEATSNSTPSTFGATLPNTGGIPAAMNYTTGTSTQSESPTYTMALQEQPVQKSYTKAHKKSHGYGKINRKERVYSDSVPTNSMSNASLGGEITNAVQREYSRRNTKTVKPVYHKAPEFKPK